MGTVSSPSAASKASSEVDKGFLNEGLEAERSWSAGSGGEALRREESVVRESGPAVLDFLRRHSGYSSSKR